MLHITEDQVRELLPMDQCVRLMREVFKDLRTGAAQNQPRRRLTLATGSALHSMAGAWQKYFGTKVYSTNPKVGANFFFLLFDAETARPLAQFEANIWARFAPARRPVMRPMFSPRLAHRRSRLSAVGFRRDSV